MSIVQANFSRRLSGGAANANGNASIGGAKSSVAMSDTIDGLFDAVSAAEALAGRVEHRLIYLHNANATDTMINARVWISQNTPSEDTTLEIGLAAAGLNATETAIANEQAAPAGVSFSSPANAAAALALGNIPPGQHYGIWLRRTVLENAAATPDDDFQIAFDCETT